jgi:hypothetical protein
MMNLAAKMKSTVNNIDGKGYCLMEKET